MNIWGDGENIVRGVLGHYFNGDTPESKRRMEICTKCPNVEEGGALGPRCGLCGCVLKFKTKSESKCPDNRW